jgi:HEAT repeat protein
MRAYLLPIVALLIAAIAWPAFGQDDPLSTTAAPEAFAKAIQQRKDAALRADALKILKGKLREDSSPSEQIWALSALRRAITAKFDREPFRALVLPKLQSNSPQIRELALVCLTGLDCDVDVLDAIAEMALDSDPKVRSRVGLALIQIGQGDAADTVIPALTQLLQDSNRDVITSTIRSMWGQYSSPKFDALLIELSNEREFHGVAIYHALSTMKPKSVPVCERLIEELDEPDWNNSGRAAWGLTYGVPEAAYQAVEQALIAAIPEELNDYTREQEYRALANVATEKSRPMLQSVVASEMETAKDKERAQSILDRLDRVKANS